MKLGTAQVIRANARHLPLADNSVDLVVTSPPYFALRSYRDGGEHYKGQIGDEPTPAEFVASLLEVTRECVRVLKPSGSLWVNLGDKYASSGGHGAGATSQRATRSQYVEQVGRSERNTTGVATKSLIGIPWRYALRCIDDLGLILRAEVIWSKPNGLPESVTDRVRRSHEQWFYFEQSRGDVVEPGAQALPLCSLCGRPADTRASLVARLHEVDPGVEYRDLPNEVGPDERVERESGLGAEQPRVVGAGGTAVPLAVPGDADLIEDAADLLDDGLVSVVDQDAKVRAAGTSVGERHAALTVDNAGEPSEVCRCSHPLIVDGEPWVPQSLAADLMQMVADGEADAQAVADFLSGDYARSHSTWFHFTLEPRYFSAVDEIREPQSSLDRKQGGSNGSRFVENLEQGRIGTHDWTLALNPLGKLPGSVWIVPTEPLRVPDDLGIDHFAAFPTEWPKRIIQGWSPAGVCVECGEGRRPVTSEPEKIGGRVRGEVDAMALGVSEAAGHGFTAIGARSQYTTSRTISGYVCACPEPTAPTTPAVVLDPFGGTGTTAMVAKALGRHGISVDMSADYCRLAEWRTNDRDQLAKVLGIAKAEQQPDEQLSMFDLNEESA